MTTRDVVLLGSTGSVGTQAVDVADPRPGPVPVTALAAGGSDVALLAEQAARLRVRAVGISRTEAADELRARLDAVWPADVAAPTLHVGPQATTELAALGCDMVLNAVAGLAGPAGHARRARGRPRRRAGQQGVADRRRPARHRAGRARAARAGRLRALGAGAVPARRRRAAEVRRLLLTASGGPFRGRSRAELGDVTPAQALAHPTWDMGPLVTTNSATLVNKGLEVIEAHLLFDVPVRAHRRRRAPAVDHPLDGRVRRRLDHRAGLPAGHAAADRAGPGLARPRPRRRARAVDWTAAQTWTFEPLDADAFPAVDLARASRLGRGLRPGGLQRRQRGPGRGVPRRDASASCRSSTRWPMSWASG